MQNVSMKKMPDAGGDHEEKSADTAGEELQIDLIKDKVDQFTAINGRRPRILISHIGPRGQRRILNQMAAIFAQRGFDVDIGPTRQTPDQAALMAIENDVHVVCLVGDSELQSQVARDVFDVLRAQNCDDILVAFLGETCTGAIRRRAPSGRYGPVGFQPAAADAGIITILEKLTRKN